MKETVNVNIGSQAFTLDTVRTAMHRMGAPSDFGERRGNTARQEDEEAEPETRKLYRSRTDRSIAGICGGLADFFHVDATVMRLLMLFLIIFGGLSIWAYIILWIIIPEQPAPKFNINRKNR